MKSTDINISKFEEEQLSMPNIKWIFNEYAGIFHPLVEFDVSTENTKSMFPLTLKEVILGHKCAESLVNRVQKKSYLSTSPKIMDSGIEIEV